MVVPGFVSGMIQWWCWSKKFWSAFIMRSVRRGGYPRALLVHFPFNTIIGLALKRPVAGSKNRVIGCVIFFFSRGGYPRALLFHFPFGTIVGYAVEWLRSTILTGVIGVLRINLSGVSGVLRDKGSVFFVVFSGIIIAIQWPDAIGVVIRE